METVWRLIIDKARDPRMNMAIDEAIMLCQLQEESLPTLRFYGWSHPCISIGRFQDHLTLTLSPSGRGGGEGNDSLPIVRRPTGGGAVFHNEPGLTYSLIYKEGATAIPKGVSNSYREIHGGLLQALRDSGIEAELCSVERKGPASVCFSSPVKSDIVCGPKKIAGAAQRRRFGVVLHQGEVDLGLDVFGEYSYNMTITAFIGTLSKRLKSRFVEGRISDKEENLAEELIMEEVKR